jgi:hypothetical protein
LGAAALVARHPRARRCVARSRLALLAAGRSRAERQLAYWRDTRTLFEHALAVDPDNAMAHASLGAFAEREGPHAADDARCAHLRRGRSGSRAGTSANLRGARGRARAQCAALHGPTKYGAEHERRPQPNKRPA